MSRRVLVGVATLSVLLVGAVGMMIGMVYLWRQRVVELPPVAVRAIGRVEGIASVGEADVVLPVPFHRQEHSLSCEVATLKMALGSFGIDVAEAEIIRYLPFDSTPRRAGVWGNPDEGFVGDIDGVMLVSGYGVYADPIARLGLRWKRTEVLRGASAADIARHIAAGRPVIVWGYYGRGGLFTWMTPGGESIAAVDGEHTRVVVGFSGPLQAPTGFSLLDPITGVLHWSTKKFMHNWETLGCMAVVVYPHPRWVRAAGEGRVWEISEDGTTRQWVRDWQVFTARGGFPEAIVEVDKEELLRYKQGSDLIS